MPEGVSSREDVLRADIGGRRSVVSRRRWSSVVIRRNGYRVRHNTSRRCYVAMLLHARSLLAKVQTPFGEVSSRVASRVEPRRTLTVSNDYDDNLGI